MENFLFHILIVFLFFFFSSVVFNQIKERKQKLTKQLSQNSCTNINSQTLLIGVGKKIGKSN